MLPRIQIGTTSQILCHSDFLPARLYSPSHTSQWTLSRRVSPGCHRTRLLAKTESMATFSRLLHPVFQAHWQHSSIAASPPGSSQMFGKLPRSCPVVHTLLGRGFSHSEEKKKKSLHGSAWYSIKHARTKSQTLSADKSSWFITTQWLFYIMICVKIQTSYNGF